MIDALKLSEGEPLTPAEAASILVDQIEGHIIAKLPPVKMPLQHIFTPGLYTRKIFIPKGTITTTKIHKSCHPYVISMGVVSVWTEEEGVKHLSAPHHGITYPGTRRVIYAHTDTVWTTFHPTNETDIEKIEELLIEKHENPLVPKDSPCLVR